MSEPALNPFLVHTDLPTNSGGSDDPARRYQYQAHLEVKIDASDRVYKNPETGRFFRIRFFRDTALDQKQRFGNRTFIVSGAHCDADGYVIINPRTGHEINAESSVNCPHDDPTELLETVERQRLICCAETELAVKNEAAASLIPVRERT